MMADREGIDLLNDDMIQNILARLPALSFAAAACVSKTWYRVTTQILSRPRLASALSLNPSLMGAVDEVLEKVLSKPIRPDFAIACISEKYGLKLAHQQLTQALGTKTPLVTHISNGVMGVDALTDELKEVQWEYFDYSCPHPRESNVYGNTNQGVVLVIGYLPGMKVDTVPFIHSNEDPEIYPSTHENFLGDIKAHTASVSVNEFPAAIMMFGDLNSDVNSIVARLNHAMPKETVIVGDAGGCFLFNSLNYTIPYREDSYLLDAVALVFAKDKDKSPDAGEIRFHVVMAGGLMPFGPRFEVVNVGTKPCQKFSWLRAKLEGHDAILNIEALMETICEMVDDESPDLYIAVTRKRRYFSRESPIPLTITSTAFYEVTGAEGPTFFIDGVGDIKPGDSFVFHYRDRENTFTAIGNAFDHLEILKEKPHDQEDDFCEEDDFYGEDDILLYIKPGKGDVGDVFGGLVFSSRCRGESYFGAPKVDASPFTQNFPGVPVAGLFCKGEIGRGSPGYITEEDQYALERNRLHACSAIYMVMSHLPASSVN